MSKTSVAHSTRLLCLAGTKPCPPGAEPVETLGGKPIYWIADAYALAMGVRDLSAFRKATPEQRNRMVAEATQKRQERRRFEMLVTVQRNIGYQLSVLN